MNKSLNLPSCVPADDGASHKPVRLLPPKVAFERTTTPSSTAYPMIKDGTYPMPVRVGPNRIAFLESEIDGWILARAAERDAKAQPIVTNAARKRSTK